MASHDPDFRPGGAVAAVGSLPFETPEQAFAFVARWYPEVPSWPQLPLLGPQEGMLAQFIPADAFVGEGFSCIDVARLAGHCEAGDAAYPAQAAIDRLVARPWPEARALKGQVTGAATLCNLLQDECGDPLMGESAEVVVRWMSLVAQRQAAALARVSLPVIITVDEPMLGSRHGGARLLAPVLDAIREAGAIAAMHCCSGEDWEAILSVRTDIVSFDASRFLDEFLAARGLDDALASGFAVAWGAVPTDFAGDAEALARDFAARLRARFGSRLPSVVDRSLVTPACGLGMVGAATAEHVMSACHAVSAALRTEARAAT